MFSNRTFNILVPIISVILGLLAGAVIMLAFGYNPVAGYIAMWNGAFGDAYFLGETVRQVTPYILSGLAVAFAMRAGLLNIGVEGQVIVGWLAAVWVGSSFGMPPFVHVVMALIAAAVAGSIWGFVPGLLKAKLGVHEVIVTIMMNYIALYLSNSVIRSLMTDGSDRTDNVAETASLAAPWLREITFFSRIHYGFIVALLMAFTMWFVLNKTTRGFELRAVGSNPFASEYAGMKVGRNIIIAMLISGGFAGLAGAMEGLGTFQYASVSSGFTNIGFDGIAVALLGANTAIGVVLAAILFGTLKIGALNMPTEAGVPTELVDIVIALIILFVASGYIIRWVFLKFSKEGK